MKGIREISLGVVSLALGACCCFGHGGAKTTNVEKATTSRAKAADPEKIKAVKKVAIVSVFADCDIKNETEQAGSVWSAAGGISAMKHQDDTRTSATIEVGAAAFADEVSKNSGWQVMPLAEMTANPAYAANTFSADLHEQVAATRKMLGCSGGGYRVLTEDYADKAAALAKALGVDGVILAQFVEDIQYESRGVNATGTAWMNFNIVVLGNDGSLLLRDRLSTKSDDTMPMTAGKLDWTKVPALGVSALRNGAKKFDEDVRKQTGMAPMPMSASTPAPMATPMASPAPTSSPAPVKSPAPMSSPAPMASPTPATMKQAASPTPTAKPAASPTPKPK
jgi:hypothetical protein